jgi:acyl-CoA reductase-like NAD-dependent aldehyde dehydrogenase
MNASVSPPVQVYHVVKGETLAGAAAEYGSGGARFATPALDLDALVWTRETPPPAADVPVAEIIEVLEAVGDRLAHDPDGVLAEALERNLRTNPLPRDLLERAYATVGLQFERRRLEHMLEQELGGPDVVDGWREVRTLSGRAARVRAFPPRLVHVLAGNGPGVAAGSLIRGALVKGANLFKLPSNDLFTGTAVLRALAAAAPGHPLTRSFSAVYWRGGDAAVESMLFRPQYFDKLVAWGGEAAIRSAVRYLGPGFELVSFDPKTSISLVGREAFASEAALAEAAEQAAHDATILNQQACVASRFIFVEASTAEADRFAARLQDRLGLERPFASAALWPIPAAIREEAEALKDMPEFYRVFGGYDGQGLVIRSDEPVDFHPEGKVVNLVPVERLADAIRHVTVATQTVGVYPRARKSELRDALAAAGAQRIVALGEANPEVGLPHDGFYPLHRFVRWVNDEG